MFGEFCQGADVLLRDFCSRAENEVPDGFLSVSHGFMPQLTPRADLPGAYEQWNTCARALPAANAHANAGLALAGLELLRADDAAALPDEYLPRAATVLSLLACAYWRRDPERFFSLRIGSIDPALPDAIFLPWQDVCRRLGRGERPYQSIADLFANNFRLEGVAPGAPYVLSSVRIEALRVLTPAFDNEAERVFFMSFVEMLALSAPLVGWVCEIQEAMRSGDAARVGAHLSLVADAVRRCRGTLRKVCPHAGSKTHCDPLQWAKTVAIFAVPPAPFVQGGTSGAFVPLMSTIDALLGRKNYSSHYGQYVANNRGGLLPQRVQRFIELTHALDVRGYVLAHQGDSAFASCVDGYNALVDALGGPDGFLAIHRGKVLSYLATATMFGRNQSTSGDERYTHAQTWVDVSSELRIAKLERRELRLEPVSALQ